MRDDTERLVRSCSRDIESAVRADVARRGREARASRIGRELAEARERAVRRLADELDSRYADVDDYIIRDVKWRYEARRKPSAKRNTEFDVLIYGPMITGLVIIVLVALFSYAPEWLPWACLLLGAAALSLVVVIRLPGLPSARTH